MTLLEWYAVGQTYADLMAGCEDLIRFIARRLGMADTLSYQGLAVDLSPPWPRLTVADAFDRYASISSEDALTQSRFDEIMGWTSSRTSAPGARPSSSTTPPQRPRWRDLSPSNRGKFNANRRTQ